MRSTKGLPLALAPALALAGLVPFTAILSGCAGIDEDDAINPREPYAAEALPLGAERGPVKRTLTAEETRDQFRDLAAEDYVVKKGDTLWSIANHFLKDPYYWPEIWYGNQEIENPHRIYPGDRITIMFVGDRPRLAVGLRPHIRYESLPPAVSAVPLELVRPFLSYDQVLDQSDFEAAPYILANREGALHASTGDTVYARGIEDQRKRFAVVSQGKALRDGRTDELLGYRAIFKGEANLVEAGDPATLTLADTVREIEEGNRLVEMTPEAFTSDVTPQIPAFPIDARIILLPDAITQIGNQQVAIIDRGADNGVSPGDLLQISKRGRVVEDRFGPDEAVVRLPDYPIGSAMVFRVYDRVSYALVIKATKPIHAGDLAQTPVQGDTL
ncbi:MAG: LysM peptidoglycan-binding domain-containing protein [Halothiobacillaceae bacterium]|nr:LysM peptidoglycan-binding domain-containing protein [Halothiobacillaceae bacterium]HER35012.1 LysM peptidoglycan-binding domain-containing protein [Halothiobacillaceae bacterium]